MKTLNEITRREPLRLYNAIRVGWLILLGGQAFTDLIPTQITALLILATAALSASVDEWVRGKVTPIAAPQDNDGTPLVRQQPVEDTPPEG